MPSTEPIDLITQTTEYLLAERLYRGLYGRNRAGENVLTNQPAIQGLNEGLLLLAEAGADLPRMQALCLTYTRQTVALPGHPQVDAIDPVALAIATAVCDRLDLIEHLSNNDRTDLYQLSQIPGVDQVLAALLFQRLIDIRVAEPVGGLLAARRLNTQLLAIGGPANIGYAPLNFDRT